MSATCDDDRATFASCIAARCEIGSKLSLWSEVGAGTEVELRIPASVAYIPSRRHGSVRRLFERFVRKDALSQPADPWTFVHFGVLGAALAMLGPGGCSVDARLFGRKNIQIPRR
jgi:hypothetical protein